MGNIKTTTTQSSLATMPTDETAQLLAAFCQGDSNAFSKLYDMYVGVLYNYGSRIITDHELLKDCIHDVFIKLYAKQNEMTRVENFRSYLFISLKNRIFDELRRSTYTTDEPAENFDITADDDIEECYFEKERRYMMGARIKKLLSVLSPRQRQAVTLYYLEERKYDDICQIMNLNYQSIRNLMHRSLNKLKCAGCF